MRRKLARSGAIGVAVCGLVASGIPAAAVAPQEWVDQGTRIECSASTDATEVFFGGFFAPDGSLADGGGGVMTDEQSYWVDSAEGSLHDGSWSLTLHLIAELDGTPAGSVQAEGAASPIGEPFTIDERFRDGNAWVTQEGSVQPLMVSGAIVAGTGVGADLVGTELGCGGETVDVTFGGTNPATRIYRWSGSTANCAIGEDGVFWLDAQGAEAYGLVALGIDWDLGTADLVAEGVLAVDEQSVTGTLEVVQPPESGGQVVIDLSIGSAIDKGHLRETWRQGAGFERFTLFPLTGTIALPDGTVLEVPDCTLRDSTYKVRDSMRAGQKPGGKAPANDLPSGALALGIGDSVSVSTRGAADFAEVPCIAAWGEELPFGRTVWYWLQGTGDVVRLSTEGSDFDTVLGVYDESLGQVACVDDTEETGLQASLDLPTDLGTAYLVQVGGFAGEWGRAVVSAR